jgi:hypothetical protein
VDAEHLCGWHDVREAQLIEPSKCQQIPGWSQKIDRAAGGQRNEASRCDWTNQVVSRLLYGAPSASITPHPVAVVSVEHCAQLAVDPLVNSRVGV